MIMRLLFLLFVTFCFTNAWRAVFDCAQQEVIKKLEDDTTGFDKRIAQLIETLKGKIPPTKHEETTVNQNEVETMMASDIKVKSTKPPANRGSDLEKAIGNLGNLTESILLQFNSNLIWDLFPENNTKEIFGKIEALLDDKDVQEAVDKHCESNKKCQHPFPKLSEKKAKAQNQKTLKSAFDSYWKRLDQSQVLADVVSKLKLDISVELLNLVGTIKGELDPIDSFSLPARYIKEKNLLLTDEFKADVVKVKGAYNQAHSDILHNLSLILRAARSALSACQAVLDEKGSPSCKNGDIPFEFVLDPSNLKAFDGMVAAYDARVGTKDED